MKPIVLYFQGDPVAKGRARFTKSGHAFTPAKTRKWEDSAKYIAQQKMQGRSPLNGAIKIDLSMVFVPSKSWPQWKKDYALRGLIAHTKKPDADNIQKAVKDAMNQIVYEDDAQIMWGDFHKKFGPQPMVIVKITELDMAPCTLTSKKDVDAYLARKEQTA